MTGRLRAAFAATLLVCSGAALAAEARIAIIIDDIGYQYEAGMRAIGLPGPLAFAVLPGTPNGTTLARHAYGSGKDVLLHLPLQARPDEELHHDVEIHLDMSRSGLREALQDALAAVPFAIGINNHRGSMMTRHPGHMQWLMEAIRERDTLFFVDSYTTHKSVALQMAQEAGVEALRRDVFLDPDRSPETVAREFARLKRVARLKGAAIAIGHPYPATLELLERELPGLAAEGIELVSISEMLR